MRENVCIVSSLLFVPLWHQDQSGPIKNLRKTPDVFVICDVHVLFSQETINTNGKKNTMGKNVFNFFSFYKYSPHALVILLVHRDIYKGQFGHEYAEWLSAQSI